MRTLASLVLLAAAPGFAAAQATKEDLKKLAKAGISEDVILTYIRANGYNGKPSSDDLIELKDAGVTDRILAGILSPEPAPAPAAPPARTEAPTTSTVYVERSVYPTGYLSLGPIYSYSSSYCPPVYRSYYSGSYYRPYYSSYRPYYSSYCGPSYRSYSYHRSSSRSSSSHSSGGRIIRNGFGSRVRW